MQVDEIPGDVDPGYEPLARAFDRAEDIAFDQDRAAVGFRTPREQARGIAIFGDRIDQPFDIFQIIEAEVLPQAPG